MAADSEASYEDNVGASVEDAFDDTTIIEDAGTGAESVVEGGGSLLSKLFNLDALSLEKMFTGNCAAVCMAVIVATILVFLMYKLLTRQSRRDKAKEAKKKLKQQKNSTKENKKKV